MNLFYCGNDKVFDGVLLSLLSILKYTNRQIDCYLLTMDCTDRDARFTCFTQEHSDYLERLLQEKNAESKFHLVDMTELFRKEMSSSANVVNFYTPYTLARLFADVLPFPDKLLYLDTDTLAHDDVSKLYDIDISDYEVGSVSDYLGRWFIGANYFNAGVLLLNLKMIRETGYFEKCRVLLRKKKMAFPDQDALNKTYTKRLVLDTKFNSQRRLYPDTVIQHFCKSIRWLPFYHTINVKPWEIESVHKRLKIFEYDDILEEYQKRKEEL